MLINFKENTTKIEVILLIEVFFSVLQTKSEHCRKTYVFLRKNNLVSMT